MHRSCFAVIVACLLAACLSESAPKVGLPPADFATDETNLDKRAGEYIIAESDWPDYGVPGDVNHFPSYQERSLGLWINIARIGYLWYRNSYLAQFTPDGSWSAIFDGSGDSYSSVAPGFWNFNLNRAGRAHCIDVRSNSDYFSGGGGHNDANGTSASTRIHKFSSCYNAEVYINQAPAQGLYSAMTAVGSWMCDGYHYLSSTPSLTQCSRDNGLHTDGSQGQNGHRRGIMFYATQFGCGVDAGSQSSSSTTTTCDFCTSSTSKYSGKHLAAGSHVGDVNNTNPKKFLYMATVLTTGITVSSVKVIEQTPGATNTITLTKMYQGTSGAIYGSPSYAYLDSCRTYYFQLNYGSTSERYPESGYFYTYGMNCDDDWKLQGLKSECTSGVCCDTANQVFKPATTICRASAGGCDAPEYCTGFSADCPADVVREKGYVCNASRGVCEENATCDGKSGICPERKFKANRTLCRESRYPCEAGGFCNGVSHTCPTSEKRPQGYVCNASSGPCENDAVCSGTSNNCPSKRFKPKTTICRPAVGLCDYDEYCLGNSSECPPNEHKPAGTECVRTYNCTIEDSLGSTQETTCNESFKCTGKSGYCPFEEPVPSSKSLDSANRVGFSLIIVAVVSIMMLI